MRGMRSLTDPWTLGPLRIPNRVALAPLAGIGNWFVRLQARRHGAGLVFSEMVSSHAVHYGNERTCGEMLRIHPEERTGGAVSIQLFGQDPEVMRSAAARVAEAGADLIDLNMGCPVPKVCKTGAGAALLGDPGRAVAVARAAREGSGLPVTVKLRSGLRPGDVAGLDLAHRLVEEAGVAAIAFHPRSAAVHHRGRPDYELAARLVASLAVPVILTGGLGEAGAVQDAFAATGAEAVMLARGSLGNPWLFERLLGGREHEPSRAEVLDELGWVIDRAVEHLGEERAGRYLRKFYPWYLERLALTRLVAAELQESLQRAGSLAHARALLAAVPREVALAA
jgi:tRNA-dihydrouridine synthase B